MPCENGKFADVGGKGEQAVNELVRNAGFGANDLITSAHD